MTFFNPKEEVLDIELTQYGKYLLSIGKWKPVYYAFFDNDILYDGECGDIREVQNDIEPRIQENTPRMKTQHSFTSRETDFAQYYNARQDPKMSELDRIKMQSVPEKLYSLTAPLGTANLDFNKAPRLKLQVYDGEISGSSAVTSDSFQQLQIPQIEMEIVYKTKIMNIANASEAQINEGVFDRYEQAEELNLGVSSEGNYIEVTPASILLTLEEENGIFSRENFDMEVFKIEEEFDPVKQEIKEILIPLSFLPDPSPISNNILTPRPDLSYLYVPDPSFVEYYFNLYVDHEIDEGEICQSITRLKSLGIYVDEELNCPDIPIPPRRKTLYGPSGFADTEVCNTDSPDEIPHVTYNKKD
jgi:hypothetical protein